MRGHAALVCSLAAIGAAACVHDVVLPDVSVTASCGNGVVEPGEGCDVDSPGCVACEVAPTWSCDARGCTTTCGDGVDCATSTREAACDMTGYWAARQTIYLRDQVLGGVQVSSNWFFFRIVQSGEVFAITEALDCGILVTGSATVRYTPESLRALIERSGMDGRTMHSARGGSSRVIPNSCQVALDRWYAVRGLEESFLPKDFLAKTDLASLPPLPIVADPTAQTDALPAGATDPDGNGLPGLSYQIEGLANGVRDSAQLDWKEFGPTTVSPRALVLELGGAADLEESILRVTDCGGACGLVAAGARITKDVAPRLTLAFIGKAIDGPRTKQMAHLEPGVDVGEDLATCANVRLLLPHTSEAP